MRSAPSSAACQLVVAPLEDSEMWKSRTLVATLIAATLSGCDKPAPSAPEIRPVRAVTILDGAGGETVSLTGQIRAKDQASLAFRLDGRMIERLINVGDMVQAGQVIARLDPQNQQNALRSAQANLASAEALATQARLTFSRQQALLKDGWTPRARYDDAEQALQSAQAQVDSLRAQARIAQDQLSYTVLYADGPGAVTAVGAEPGEVVHVGQMVVQVARQGIRDAVFDVSEQIMRTAPRDPTVEIALTNDPTVTATGRVREVAPQADAVTRTFRVKVEISDPPAAMRLGSTVTGGIKLATPPGMKVPAGALFEESGHPAVWVIDPQTQGVSLRAVTVRQYDPDNVVISEGLQPGEVVVTAGVQVLTPGQKVRLLEVAQ
ncbi:MAG TPA: efflux RND transporter periplasmic adaptor subunit [Aliidongia sp.]|nr:efflux RND transporter periplasmic adaptor subunit [Aliidongia sp.]